MRTPRWTPFVVGAAVLASTILAATILASTILPAVALASGDPASDLKAKDYRKRLKAVAALRAEGGEKAEKLLLAALKDKDWEVVERAVEALAERGGEKALKRLVAVAAAGHVRRIRLAAAAALARLGPEEGARRLSKYLRKDEAANAAEALAVLARLGPDEAGKQLTKAIKKALKSKEAPVRVAMARALGVFPTEEQVERFQRLLDDEHLTVVAAALDSVRESPTMAHLPALTARLARADLDDVLARRAIAAVKAVFAVATPAQREDALDLLADLVTQAASKAIPAARVARLIGLLGTPAVLLEPEPAAKESRKPGQKKSKKEPKKPPKQEGEPKAKDGAAPAVPPEAILVPADSLPLLEILLAVKFEGARAAAVRALRIIGVPKAIERAVAFLEDPHARVRFQALHALSGNRGLPEAPALERLTTRLLKDADPSVREEAAVLLGRSGAEGSPNEAPVAALTEALNDKTWSVAVVAAVSLGKTRAEAAVEPLAAQLNAKVVKDWRRRAAAVVGLGKVRRRSAVPHLIRALKDRDGWVRRNAFEFLKRLTKRTIMADAEQWSAWWKRNGSKYEFEDRERTARLLKKGGYATKPVDVYDKGKGALDVVVLQSRGDHIEKLLDELGIAYRITRAAQVHEADVHSFAVFVANCTGEIQKRDIERLRWFVRVGGYLFCSCWALHHTVEHVYPGLVRKLPTKGEVLDNVRAEACPGDSPFLKGVFRSWTRPTYVLFGSHLIQVLQPERVEVLIDSPQAAARWGGGNMACWFPAGHGVILDSANHFDLQGLERVNGLKTAEDRMAYAMDHMGLDYMELRRLAAGRVWDRQADAVKLVRDLSAFRFLTNFARLKRRTDP